MFSRHSFKFKNQKIAKNSWPARDFAIGSLSLSLFLFSLEIGIEKCLFPFSIPFGGVLERSSVVWLERPRVIYNPRRTRQSLSSGLICCDVVLFDNESREKKKKKKKMVCGPVIDRYRCCGPTRVALFWDASISIGTRRHLRVTLTRRRFLTSIFHLIIFLVCVCVYFINGYSLLFHPHSVPTFMNLQEETLIKIADVLDEVRNSSIIILGFWVFLSLI
jgi:hypothetical protein